MVVGSILFATTLIEMTLQEAFTWMMYGLFCSPYSWNNFLQLIADSAIRLGYVIENHNIIIY